MAEHPPRGRIAVLLSVALCLGAARADAFSFGMGTGAARASQKTADKAAQTQNCTMTGQRLFGRGGTVTLTAAPINPANVVFISPLGNLNPPGHTFPTDH